MVFGEGRRSRGVGGNCDCSAKQRKLGDMAGVRVSVVIPARDAAPWILECLDSVRAQTRAADEVLLADDGSRDATAELVRRAGAGVRLLGLPGEGAARARNLAVGVASGDWVAFLDADDAWEPDKLERQLEAIARHPEAGLVFSDARIVTEAGSRGRCYLDGRRPERLDSESLLMDNFICTSTVLARRELLIRVGGFPERLRIAHDYALWLECLAVSPAALVDEPLVRYRQNPTGLSADTETAAAETLEVVARASGARPAAAVRERLASLHYQLAHHHLAAGKLQTASSHFSEAVRLAPMSWRARLFDRACRLGPGAVALLKSLGALRRA